MKYIQIYQYALVFVLFMKIVTDFHHRFRLGALRFIREDKSKGCDVTAAMSF